MGMGMGVCRGCAGRTGKAGEVCQVCGRPLDDGAVLELAEPFPVHRARTATTGPMAGLSPGARSASTTRAPLPSYDELEAPRRLLFWRVTRAPLVLLLAWFTLSHLALGAKWVFIDNVNLLFHEAGHFLFSWGGVTLTALGGTLGQLMWPAGIAAYFWFGQRNRFAAVACVWWFGENLIGIGRYMADAAFEELALVGGDIHDWNFLFGRWGLLSSGQEIGSASRWIGAVLMVAALVLLARWTLAPAPGDLERDNDAT
jgi:hypothetical protein